MDNNQELINAVKSEFPLVLPAKAGPEELLIALSVHINHLIVHNFTQLINLLYRLDVSEKKLQQWLLENTREDAGKIIAALIIERQLQKIKSRQHFKTGDEAISDEEKW